jgi:hypothetical protein
MLTGMDAHSVNQWMKEYLEENPTPKYSESGRAETDIEIWEVMLEAIGPEKILLLENTMLKHDIESFTFSELYEYMQKHKTDNPEEK